MAKKISILEVNENINPVTGLTEGQPPQERISILDTPILGGTGEDVPSRHDPLQYLGHLVGERSKYDTNLTLADLDNLERERALHQPNSHKAFNAVVGGVASGVLTAVEDIGYILDFENNIKRMMDLEEVESNWLSDIMKKGKEGLETGMPIHRMSDKVFDWSDPGFYFSSLKGILDSAVGFAIPGMAASKAIGTAQKALRATKYLNFLKQSQRGQQIINSVGAGYITNFGEGKMMALEMFENSVQQMEQNLFNENLLDVQARAGGEISPQEAHKLAVDLTMQQLDAGKRKEFESIAGDQANVFMNRNKAFALTDMVGLHGIYKGKGATRALLNEKGLKAGAKRFTTLTPDNLLVQAAKEGAEEIGQNVIQMEAEYQAAKGAGIDTDETPEDFKKRAYQFATSDKALLEGMMGFFGGGPQRVFTEMLSGNFSLNPSENYRKRYEEQQAQIKANTEFLNNKLGDFVQGQALRAEAIRRGEDNTEQFIKDSEFLKVVSDNFEKGTTQSLINTLSDIASGVDEETRVQNGWDENYQEQAEEQLQVLKNMERRYLSYSRHENQREVFYNRESRRLIQEDRNRLQEAIEEIDSELETQSTPDPALQDRKETLTKQLNQADEAIAEQDSEYKRITSAEHQQMIRNEIKRNKKKIDEKIKNDRAEAKKAAEEEKARKRKEKTTKKDKKPETKQEAAPEEEAATPQAEPDVSGVTEPTTTEETLIPDEGIKGDPHDMSFDGPDVANIPSDQIDQARRVDESKTNFNTFSDQFIDDLTKEFGDQLESDALTEGEGLSPAQRRLGLLENMLDELSVVKGERASFDDLIDSLVERYGEVNIDPLFGLIESVYKQYNVEYVPINSLKKFRELTPDERNELEGDRKVADRDVGEVYTSATEQEVNAAQERITNLIKKKDSPGDPTETISNYDYRRVESGSGILAYLSRAYQRTMRTGSLTRSEISDAINDEMPTKEILDPNQYGNGTPVTLRVEDIDSTPAYIEGDFTNTKTTWGAKKAFWKEQVKQGLLTEEQYEQKFTEQVPIAVYSEGNLLGYLHETEWINETNVFGDVEKDKERNRNIRKGIRLQYGGEYNTTIQNRSTGYLFRTKDGRKVDLSEAFEDESLTMTVGIKGDFRTSRTEIHSGLLLNKEGPTRGVTYVHIPVGNEELALPLSSKKLSENEEVINTIMTVLDIFYNERTDDQAEKIKESILTNMKMNIDTSIGFTEFIETFINNYNTGKSENLKKHLESPDFERYADDAFVTMNRRGDDDVNFEIARGLGVGPPGISRKGRKKRTDDVVEEYFARVRGELRRVYSHTNADQLNAGGNIVLINEAGEPYALSYKKYIRSMTQTPFLSHNIGTEESPNYIYLIQPVIEMDFSEFDKFETEKTTDEFKRLLKEFNDPNTSAERKVELDGILAEMYYGEEGMITEEEKAEKAKETKKTKKLDPVTGNLVELTPEEAIQKRWEQAEQDYLNEQVPSGPESVQVRLERLPKEEQVRINQGLKEIGDHYQLEIDAATKARLTEDKKEEVVRRRKPYNRGMGRNPDLESNISAVLEETQIEEIGRKTEVEFLNEEDKGKGTRGVVIKELTAAKQQEIVNFMKTEIVNKVFATKRVKASDIYNQLKKEFQENLDQAKEYLELSLQAQDQELIDEDTWMMDEMNLILKNWDKIVALTEERVSRIDGISREIDPEETDLTPEQKEQQAENANWSDLSVFTLNPSDGLAPQIKYFLSGIGQWKVNKEGEIVPVKNYLNIQKSMDYGDLYNTLQRITPNLPPDYNAIRKVLEDINKDPDKRKVYPFMTELLQKLDKASQQVKNQLVSGMTNHDVNMKFIMFSSNEKTGRTTLVEYSSNANAIAEVVRNQWNVNLIAETAEPVLEGTYIIPENTRKRLVADYDRWVSEKKLPQNELRQWLEQLGIILHDQTFKDLVNGEIYYNGSRMSLWKQVNESNGLFSILAKNLRTRGNASVISGDRLTDETVVKNLARYEAKYAPYSFSNSHRTGNKTVYSFSQNKFLVNRVRELKTFDQRKNALLDELMKLTFNGKSAWGEALNENGGDNSFTENFERWLFSLEPLKKEGSKSRDNAELHKLSEDAIEVAKIGMLQSPSNGDKSGKLNRIIKLVYPTTSEKTTVMGLRVVAQDLVLDKTGRIQEESIQKIVDYVVQPEIDRIKSYQRLKAKGEHADIEEYRGGAEQFLLLPEINNVPGVFLENGDINPNIGSYEIQQAIKNKVRDYVESLVEEKLETWDKNGIGKNKNFSFLETRFMSGETGGKHNPLRIVSKEHKVRAAATDMVFQYLIGNAEIAKLFTGDPALYYKTAKKNMNGTIRKSRTDPEYDFVADAKETFTNFNKRIAADIAPGYELADAENDVYKEAFLRDAPSASEAKKQITRILDGEEAYNTIKDLEGKELEDAVKGFVSEPYYNFDGTDAQEYTTWKEHLHVMRQAGEISDQEYHKAYKTLNAGKKLEKSLMGKVMQPMKPVYVQNKIETDSDVERRIYIKSSSFPLLPELTVGTDLENLRLAMEHKKTGVDRVAYSTAVKVGNVTKGSRTKIFDDQGRILPPDQISFENSTISLSRKGFRLQQRVPYDPVKTELNKVTQASKNLLVNMLNVEGFTVDWLNNGDPVTGEELQTAYHNVYGDLHQIELDRLKKQILDKSGNLNVEKLRNILLDEARERGYPLADIESLHLDEELTYIPFSTSANKIESLLNSIVTNRVIRLKFPGKSYVLGSEEGFHSKELTDEEFTKQAEGLGIVFTSNFKERLRPSRLGKDGKRLPAQAIVPWKFKNQNGDIIEMEKYIIEKDGKKLIDRSKVPSEVMQIFGMRIPNQGPNSQSWIEIVGFLPEGSGDLFIATKDYVVQMGSDFDVDKLYTYMYNLYEDKGFVRVHRREDTTEERKAALQNKILDIHIAIHKNPDQTVQKQIANPLGFWKLKELSSEVEELRNRREGDAAMFTGLSDEYQRRKFKNAAMSKSGVGVFSNDSMFNSVVQGKNMVYTEDGEPISIVFGSKRSDGNLSSELALDGQTFKSDIISGYQSGAVDNEKEQILDKLNINSGTFKVIKILNQLGFGEEVPLFISQDIIIDYVKELERLNSPLTGYTPNAEEEARRIVEQRYGINQSLKESQIGRYANEEATPEMMRRYIAEGPQAPNYVEAQAAFLRKFLRLDEYGQTIQELQSAINIDSRGLGKSVMESIIKEDQIYRLVDSPVTNAQRLIGEIIPISRRDIDAYRDLGYSIRRDNSGSTQVYAVKSNTINGHAVTYGLFPNNDWWTQIFRYKTPVVDALMQKIEDITSDASGTQIEAKAARRLEIWKEIKSYIYSDDELGLHNSNVTAERERILYDRWIGNSHINESLAFFVRRIKETEFGRSNAFLSKLDTIIEKNGSPSQITYRASTAENIDETDIYVAFVDLFLSTDVLGTFHGREYTKRDLAQDLVLYSYITGGIQEARQFVKYIPAAYLTSIPFAKNLSEMDYIERDFGVVTLDGIHEIYNIPPMAEQYVQHNPETAVAVTPQDMTDIKTDDEGIPYQFKLKDESRRRLGKDTRQFGKVAPPYMSMRIGNSESGMVLYKYSFSRGIYIQIDTLGTFGASEYNKNVPLQRSLIARNQSSVPLTGVPASPTTNEREGDTEPATDDDAANEEIGDTLMSDLAQGIAEQEIIENGVDKTKEVLNHIITSGSDSYQAVLADELLKHMDKLPPQMRIAVSNVDSTRAGSYSYVPHMLTLFQKGIKNSEWDANQTFLHELLHGLTGYKIAYYLYGDKKGKKGDDIRRAIKDIPNWNFTEKDRAAVKSIQVLMNQAIQAITSDPDAKKLYEEVQLKVARREGLSSKEELGLYGLTDALEFVSVALTDPVFQQMLNKIPVSSKKTFWQALKERLVRLMKAMGFKADKDSVLEHTLYETLNLIQDRETELDLEEGVKPDKTLPSDTGITPLESFMVSYMPVGSTKLGPKFQELATEKQAELKALYAKRSRLREEIKNAKNKELKHKKQIQVQGVQNKIEEIKDAILQVVNLTRLNEIIPYAEADMDTLERIFTSPDTLPSDLIVADRIIKMWQRAGDFSGNSPHPFYDEEEFKARSGRGLEEITNKFKEWADRADEYNVKLAELREKIVMGKVKGTFSEAEPDINNPIPDVNFLVKNFMDISEVDNALLQSMATWVKDANWAAKRELDEKFKRLNDLIEATGLKDFSIFQQTFGNNDPRKTGELVYRWTQSFFDWERGVKRRRDNAKAVAASQPTARAVKTMERSKRKIH
jgi:hypothetical protein